ncbi:MAG: hypothetical protein O9327_02495 [Polaromonas sp.]|nr:hypothetical protein [Polaromonas sp.]
MEDAAKSTATPTVLNVLRVALDRANWDYYATGFKDFEVEAAKAWVAAEMAKVAATGSASA